VGDEQLPEGGNGACAKFLNEGYDCAVCGRGEGKIKLLIQFFNLSAIQV
jgi:hypothetical protein